MATRKDRSRQRESRKTTSSAPVCAGHERSASNNPSGARAPARRKRPILRFVLLFALLAGPFNLLYYGVINGSAAFNALLAFNAAAAAAIMRLWGTDVHAFDVALNGADFSMTIAVGCDAIQPASLFFFAVLAFPVSLRSKWSGLLVGTLLLLLLNLVRIIALYYTGAHFPRWFDIMHIDVWQAIFIFLALFFWVVWALRATRPTAAKTNAPA